MNELHARHSARGLVVLGIPCNQFGHQENGNNDEILNSLKYVRPGNGFEPKITLLEKSEVNGEGAHPLFRFLKEKLPVPCDDPASLMTDPKFVVWSPVCRNDISWNFEKFLVDSSGEPYKRYSSHFHTSDIEADIVELLERKGPQK
uniref:Glutathione peroxidase n=2 Tax=Denticeps clupeoides TaxID=299321 RepID=A0AAY4E3D9_9TELE